jgi:hypothetical protein
MTFYDAYLITDGAQSADLTQTSEAVAMLLAAGVHPSTGTMSRTFHNVIAGGFVIRGEGVTTPTVDHDAIAEHEDACDW